MSQFTKKRGGALLAAAGFALCLAACAPPASGGAQQNGGTDGLATSETGEALSLSHESGVYRDGFSLNVRKAQSENAVYYTLDGSLPTTSSARMKGALSVADDCLTRSYPLTDAVSAWYTQLHSPRGTYTYQTQNACTVVRLLEVDALGTEVARKTKTYFVRSAGEDAFPLPVISISMPQAEAVDFYTDIESEPKARAEMEYFDFASGERFALNTQIKVGGNWTKAFPYHTMNVNFNKDENGDKNTPVTVKLFGDRTARDGSELTDFKRFRLHCGGNSQNITWFGDAFVQRAAAEIAPASGEYIRTATTGYRPCEVYLNGEYWGMYAIREHYSDVYFEQNYGVDKDDVILIDKAQNIVAGDSAYADPAVFNTAYHFEVAEDDEAEQGMGLATALFEALSAAQQLAESGDTGAYAAALSSLEAQIDVGSLIDLVLVHMYTGNWDFMNNNIKMWRTAGVDAGNPYADGKWRFCLHDLDFSFEFAWGDNGLSGANGHLLYDQSNPDYYLKPGDPAYLQSAPYYYRPSVNYLDFYLGNAILLYNDVGRLDSSYTCLLTAFAYDAEFQASFAARAREIAEIYAGDEALALFNEMAQEVDAPMKRHAVRWLRTQQGDEFDYAIWKNKLENARDVLASRTSCYGIYPNGDYFDRQVEAAFWRLNNGISVYTIA